MWFVVAEPVGDDHHFEAALDAVRGQHRLAPWARGRSSRSSPSGTAPPAFAAPCGGRPAAESSTSGTPCVPKRAAATAGARQSSRPTSTRARRKRSRDGTSKVVGRALPRPARRSPASAPAASPRTHIGQLALLGFSRSQPIGCALPPGSPGGRGATHQPSKRSNTARTTMAGIHVLLPVRRVAPPSGARRAGGHDASSRRPPRPRRSRSPRGGL